jgi:predicted SAM-dependent methyltransferase
MKLHIGGETFKEGWHILNVQTGKHTDFKGTITDLSKFGPHTVSEIYASHVFEHLGHREELPLALAQCHRILDAGGVLSISVPDLTKLASLFSTPGLSLNHRYEIMLMMFGGQLDNYDFHKTGVFEELLIRYLNFAGFKDIKKVDEFGLFDDTSSMRFAGTLISLNLVAIK